MIFIVPLVAILLALLVIAIVVRLFRDGHDIRKAKRKAERQASKEKRSKAPD